MANEEKDGLFNMSLGDGLIEVPETKEEVVEPKVEETKVETEAETTEESTKKTEEAGFTQHEDGTIEIDEYLQKTIESQPKAEEGEGEDGTDIENTGKLEKEKTPSDGDESGDSSPSSSQYLAFARDRADEGVFLDFNEEDWKVLLERNDGSEAAALRELSDISIQARIEQGVESFKESLTDQDRALYEAKVKGLPLDAYGVAKANYDKYSKIDPEELKENEQVQIDVVSKALELRGFSKEEIADEIEGYKTLEVLQSKAEKALPNLPKVFNKEMTDMEENAKNKAQAEKDKIRQGVARMKKFVDNVPEIIPGIKITKPTREKIMKSMTEPVAKDEQGNPMNPVMSTRHKNPDAFDTMIHYYHQLGLFNIDEDGNMKPDFSKIVKTTTTEVTDKLRGAFEAKEKQVAGKTKIVKSQEDELDDFEKAFRRL